MFDCGSSVHHVKVTPCVTSDNLRRTSVRPQPAAAVTLYSVTLQLTLTAQ